FNGRSRSGLSISVLARQIISERVINLFQFPKKLLVLGEFFQTTLARELEHPDRIVIRAVPQIRIEMAEQPPCRWLPGPPEVEAHLSKRLERRGKSGDHVISVESRHERQRSEIVEKFPTGKFLHFPAA